MVRFNKTKISIVAIAIAATTAISGLQAFADRVVFVNQIASGQKDGSSWPNAFTDLQQALSEVGQSNDGICEIWVASGVYHPDQGTGDQNRSFTMSNKVSIYGGFSGDETCRDEREPWFYETILSGDLAGDDTSAGVPHPGCCGFLNSEGCDDEDCFGRVTAVEPSCSEYWWDDCTSLAHEHCCETCFPNRCENTYNVVNAVTVHDAVLDGFIIESGEGRGGQYLTGGVFLWDSTMTISNCILRGNNSPSASAMKTFGGHPVVANCIFSENGTVLEGWRPALLTFDEATVRDCTFSDNYGSGMEADDNGVIERCRFLRNSGSGLLSGSIGTLAVYDSDFIENGYSGIWVGWSLLLVRSRILGNYHPNIGGGVNMHGGNILAIDSIFAGNRVGRGPVPGQDENPFPGWGGAFSGNNLGGIDRFINCTFVNNHAGGNGGAISSGEPLLLENCLFWENTGGEETQRAQIHSATYNVEANYTIIQGWDGDFSGEGSSGVDPLFVNPLGHDGVAGTEDDDLRLRPNSPAINGGDPALTQLDEIDLDGHARLLCGRIDIGAYEFGIGDYNCDHRVNPQDALRFSGCITNPEDQNVLIDSCKAFDFEGDGDVDLSDFAAVSRLLSMTKPRLNIEATP